MNKKQSSCGRWEICSDMSFVGSGLDTIDFSYTAGLRDFKHPDILIVGLDENRGSRILDMMARIAVRGHPFEPGDRSDDILESYTIEMRPVSNHNLGLMAGCKHKYGSVEKFMEYGAIQMIWPDRESRFPWDEGWDGEQMMLALPRNAMWV